MQKGTYGFIIDVYDFGTKRFYVLIYRGVFCGLTLQYHLSNIYGKIIYENFAFQALVTTITVVCNGVLWLTTDFSSLFSYWEKPLHAPRVNPSPTRLRPHCPPFITITTDPRAPTN